MALKKNIYALLEADGSYQAFLASIKIAGAEEFLKQKGPYTLFAPTDAAFARMPKRSVDALLSDREELLELISFHVLPGRLTTAEVKNMNTRLPVSGKRFMIARGKIQVNGARVVRPDAECANGIVHGIDAVLSLQKVRSA